MESELEALFTAVRGAPEDDLVRLVLADALQQAGDEHGELITLQVQQAKLLVDRDSEAWTARWERVRELIDRERQRWDDEIRGVRLDFRRGFVELASGPSPELLARLPGLLQRFPMLDSMSVSGLATPAELEALFERCGPRLRELSLPVDDELAPVLARHASALRRLSLDAGELHEAGASALCKARWKLTHFQLEGGEVDLGPLASDETRELVVLGAPASGLVARAPALRALRLAEVESLPAFPKGLEALTLEACALGKAGAQKVARAGLTAVRRLSVRTDRLGAAGAVALLTDGAFPLLEDLTLREVKLTDDGLRAVLEQLGGRPVQRLDLGDNELTDASVARLTGLGALKSLGLSRNRLTQQGVATLRLALPATNVIGAHQRR